MSYSALIEWAKTNEREALAERQQTQRRLSDLQEEGEERLEAERRKLWLEWALLVFVLLAMLGISLLQFFPGLSLTRGNGTATTATNSAETTPETSVDETPPQPDSQPDSQTDSQTEVDRALQQWQWDWGDDADDAASNVPSRPEPDASLGVDRALGQWQWDWTDDTHDTASAGVYQPSAPQTSSGDIRSDRPSGDADRSPYPSSGGSSTPSAVRPSGGTVEADPGVNIWLPEGSNLYAVGKDGEKVTVRCESLSHDGFSATIVSEQLPDYVFLASNLDDCVPGVYRPGDAIATVGDPQNSGEPHFHWEVRQDGTPIEPPLWSIEYVIKGDLSVYLPHKPLD
ncbi:M23 family metallopeptidase [Baaleninema sp.]|uniref:M23 family metallopeptidase n=1 Tax=Baaleninema sp. TaxID=3101197 RepID=UPI003D0395DD